MKLRLTFFTALLVVTAAQAADTKLWYDKPAANWMTEALPVGNGDLGAMVFGKTDIERIQFNEKSLWTGNEVDTGSYQAFGDLLIQLGHEKPSDYRRELDLERGVATVSYSANGVRYQREVIASYPSGVVAIRLTADKPGAYSGKLWLTDMHGADVLADGRRLTATGVLNNGMDYESQALVINDGGKVGPILESGFDNKPVKRVRPEVPVLDGTKDVYLSLRVSDKPVFGYFSRRSNDDATPIGLPLVIGGEWFDRGVSFETPNDFTFDLDGKYQWLTFHAQVAEGGALQIILDGKQAKEITASKDAQYVAIPVAGIKKLKLNGASSADPKSHKPPVALLGHLRVSPAKTEPEKDHGIAHRWTTVPGSDAMIPPVAMAFDKCDSLTILLGAKTSYLADHSKGWRGPHPHEALKALMDKAAKQPFGDLLSAHEKDYRNLFGRVSLDFGKTPAEVANLPTDQRFLRYDRGEPDPGFEPLVFQLGRYLLIACSRPGGLPANLQGVWNASTAPAWRGDYHSNEDFQMCYWPAELTGLSECHIPFFDFVTAQAPGYRKNMQTDREMVKRFPNHRGWTIRTETGVFGASSWELNTAANAWYCQHYWQHFEFGQDRQFLRDQAYPMMKQTCEFWIDHLTNMPDGRIATPDGWSAEWGPREPAVTYDQELIWDLFTSTVAAADVLGTDKEFRDKIATMRDKLVTPSVGKHGQLKEWFEDKDDMTNTYRHISHLWALHPGKQITLQGTSDLAAAARVTLNARGDEAVGWSASWKINWWARLQDAERAYKLVRTFVRPLQKPAGQRGNSSGLGVNLINLTFQLEAQLGFTAGIAEMLLQSHAGEIHLLPALPKAWPEGKITGLRARGGFTVDIEWKDGKVTTYRITSPEPREVKIRFNGETKTIQTDVRAEMAVADKLAPLKPLFDFPVRDTCVCLGPDKTYYLTGTTGHPTWWKTNDGIRVWKSKDLKTWEPLGLVWSFEKDATWQKINGDKRAIWAPELHYFKNTFWIAYCLNYRGTGILRSKTGKAEGPYEDMKPDGPLTGEIDASLFADDDGKVYFVWQNGKIARLKDDMSGLAEEPRLLKPANAKQVGFEGAFLAKINGRYHLICAEFNKHEKYSTYDCMAASADSIYGPYGDMYLAVPHGGHNVLFEDSQGRWWSTFFGNDPETPFRERPAILPIRINAAGRIEIEIGGGSDELPTIGNSPTTKFQ